VSDIYHLTIFLGLGMMHGKAMELLGGMSHKQEGTSGPQ
jgi:hypothetical protein